ncbi:multidrug ABC transporter ATP-binding protein [Pilimelia terevasa]|uniref:Multidrug ABC transporter ATP-binding protein n=1 Tax=Pilimelia terevasa TaxID=53372 RepID=A0A8J3FG35_9ACTN|nr:ABC transporter ATP-binding protein [Pilimelia terevasa]GGK23468.1 multidrug ABC transporter ATP-binding protein [Pilimelia terevasa]
MPPPPTGGSVLRGAVSRHRRRLGLGALLVAAHQAGEAAVPVVVGQLIDRAVRPHDLGALGTWVAVLAALFATFSLSYRFGARFAERAAELTAHEIRLAVAGRVIAPHGGAERGRLAGETVNIATDDAERVGDIHRVLPFTLAAVVGLLVGGFALLRASVPLGLLVLLAAPPLLYLAYLLSRPLERRSEAQQDRAAHASGVAADLVAGLRVLKGLRAEPAAVARYRRTSRQSLAATLHAARAQAGQEGTMFAVTGLLLAAVALVGGRLALAGDITVGQLVTAVGLAQYLLGPLSMFSWFAAAFAQARASAGRVAALLASPAAVTGAAAPAAAGGALRVRGLAAGPLRGLDLDVAPGECVAVATADPACASALLACLARERDPDAGTVLLDGAPLDTLDPVATRRHLLVAAHDAALFEESLTANIAGAGADPDAVDRAVRAAGVDDIRAHLPEGAATVLAERGRSLSGGQRQRVALARALAAAPPVLVLHDPTTAVDTVTESRIADGLRSVRAGRTTVLVATSPALLAAADRVVLVADGVAVDSGTHAALVARRPDYLTLVFS